MPPPMAYDRAEQQRRASRAEKELGTLGKVNPLALEEFAALADKLWGQVKPLYDELHCYTRAKLNAKYGDAVQPANGPIRPSASRPLVRAPPVCGISAPPAICVFASPSNSLRNAVRYRFT